MNKTTYFSIALSLAMAGSAVAADLPSRRAPPVYVPPPVPVFTWTGFYVGGQVGYEFGDTTESLGLTGIRGLGAAVGPFKVGQTSAAIGGAHVGYNYQLGNALGAGLFGGGLVVGLEGDIEGSNNTSTLGIGGGGGAVLFQHKGQIEGSVRGRLGIAVDRALFYATGGAAFAQFKDSISLAVGPLLATVDQASTSRVGYTVGGGMEYAVTPNWSLRGEYRYTDFGSYSHTIPVVGAVGIAVRNSVVEQKVELGVSYRFADDFVPVVARY